MSDAVQTEYSARDFNRNPGAIARAAHRFGSVRITHRGQPSLVVLDASQYPDLATPTSRSLLASFQMEPSPDDDIIGEPPRLGIGLSAVT
jgi:prevent-host-death family protein